jgi:2-polyprenyl-6-methoxyphenol hydroxylase-like FAD-dependent oxidoreductase
MKEVPVLIAGGGPVGMTLAKTLASFGIECMLVERNPSTTPPPQDGYYKFSQHGVVSKTWVVETPA